MKQPTSSHLVQPIAWRRPDLGLNSKFDVCRTENLVPCAMTEGEGIFFKGRLIEPVLGGPLFWLRCSSRRHGYLVPLSSTHGTRLLFGTRRSLSSGPGPDASKQLAARDGNLMPIPQPLAYLHTSVFVAFLFLWECRLLLLLLACTTHKLVGDLCPPCSL